MASVKAVTKQVGRRVMLRPLMARDFNAWRDVRRRNTEWLKQWEPRIPVGAYDIVEDPQGFTARCEVQSQERSDGRAYGFGIFIDGHLRGEMNLTAIQRGPFQSCYLGYWIDQDVAGNGYTPEALVVAMRFGFETLRLHRMQVAIVPRNAASLRVVEKLGLRHEGTAQRYVQINGIWEDHHRFAITVEEWLQRADELLRKWVFPDHETSSRPQRHLTSVKL